MAYTKPPYIAPKMADPDLNYIWDDTRTGEDFKHDGEWLPKRLQNVYLTAQIALGIGIYEWIVWRFQALSTTPIPVQLAEAAWCATVHPEYMEEANFDRHRWTGPIRGPLWCAQTWLVPMARCDSNSVDECQDGLDFLFSLAMHVLPNTEVFESWLNACIDRILNLYATPEKDMFSGLFGDPMEERGLAVTPSLLDLTLPFDPSTAEVLISQYLVEARRSKNPFLVDSEKT